MPAAGVHRKAPAVPALTQASPVATVPSPDIAYALEMLVPELPPTPPRLVQPEDADHTPATELPARS